MNLYYDASSGGFRRHSGGSVYSYSRINELRSAGFKINLFWE